MKEYKFLENYAVRDAWQLEPGLTLDDNLEISPEIIKDLTDVTLNMPVSVNLVWQKDDKTLVLTLSIKSSINQECSKCLKIFNQELSNKTEYEFAQSVNEDDDRIKITSDLTVNLTQPIIDTFVTAIDQFPVCSNTCPGLCPTCGINLNENKEHRKTNPAHFSHPEVDNKPKMV